MTVVENATVMLSGIPLSEYRFYWFNIVSNLKENSYGTKKHKIQG